VQVLEKQTMNLVKIIRTLHLHAYNFGFGIFRTTLVVDY